MIVLHFIDFYVFVVEQENAIVNENSSNSSEEVNSLRQTNKELNAELNTTKAELQAVLGDNEQLTDRCKQMASKLKIYQRKEQQLQQQIQTMKEQLDNQDVSSPLEGGNVQSEKLSQYRAAASRQIEVLKLRYTKAESRIASLQTELKGKTLENEKLAQISDSLISMLESANLE